MKKQILILLVLLTFAQANQQDDRVNTDDLEKFKVVMNETLYSGYLPVNEDGSAQFFYMFVFADPKKPITLWLNGGPGCSSAQGLFNENGPINFIRDTQILKENDYSWTKLSNILYLESPIGVGFSYGDKTKLQTDEGTAKYNLQALISFFKRFYQFQGSDFYISGESYAGIYIPTLASEILDYNAGPKSFAINLKGFMIGNGCTDITECTDMAGNYPQHRFSFFGGHNLISPDTHKKAMDNVKKCFGASNQDSNDCEAINDQVNIEFTNKGNLNPYNVYGDCPHHDIVLQDQQVLKRSNISVNDYLFNPSLRGGHIPPCSDDIGVYGLFRDPNFLKVIHVDTTKSSVWDVCTNFSYKRGDKASYHLYPKLIQNGLRVWKFSGDIDSVVPITGTLFWIHQLQNEFHLRTIVPWRPWYQSGERDTQRQVGGNFWKIDGLTFVSVRDAGHMVPTDKKQAAFELFRAFLNDQVLPAQ